MLLTTSGSGDWKTDQYKIDIITSASKKEKINSLSNEIIKFLENIL